MQVMSNVSSECQKLQIHGHCFSHSVKWFNFSLFWTKKVIVGQEGMGRHNKAQLQCR